MSLTAREQSSPIVHELNRFRLKISMSRFFSCRNPNAATKPRTRLLTVPIFVDLIRVRCMHSRAARRGTCRLGWSCLAWAAQNEYRRLLQRALQNRLTWYALNSFCSSFSAAMLLKLAQTAADSVLPNTVVE